MAEAEPPSKRLRRQEAAEEDEAEEEDEEDQEDDEEDDDGGDSDEESADGDEEEKVTLIFGPDDSVGTAAVIWMHGLGDTPSGWGQLARSLQQQPALQHTRWILPCAPERAVTCNGGDVMTSWMDLHAIPISPSTPDTGKDLPESITMVHKLIDDLVAQGVPTKRIVLGGFSQGAALALAATLKYPKPLAGACVLSGWGLKSLDLAALVAASPNKGTPFLVCHGEVDGVVTPACGRLVRKVLEEGRTPVEYHSYPGMAHGSCKAEERDLSAFLKRVVP